MRLPHDILLSLAFSADHPEEVVAALGEKCANDEADEIVRLFNSNLPPITSVNALAVMTGFNLGFVWSIMNRQRKHYRVFEIPKGSSTRMIEAPRIGLKIIQKWLSFHIEKKWTPHVSVHGFVSGKSHITAAREHIGAEWLVTVDIENFFPSTSVSEISTALKTVGYRTGESLETLLGLCCFHGRLAQGAPTSPVLSNIALDPVDKAVSQIAESYNATFTRYADDIVLSGKGRAPADLLTKIDDVFMNTKWALSKQKRYVTELPGRLKVHGLLVDGDKIRLTKGYRNKVRAYKHLYEAGKIADSDMQRIVGHIKYASQIISKE